MTAKIERRNLRLIYDRDHGPENYGWYTRCDEYLDGELLNAAVEEWVNSGDADYSLEDAIKAACDHLGCQRADLGIHE